MIQLQSAAESSSSSSSSPFSFSIIITACSPSSFLFRLPSTCRVSLLYSISSFPSWSLSLPDDDYWAALSDVLRFIPQYDLLFSCANSLERKWKWRFVTGCHAIIAPRIMTVSASLSLRHNQMLGTVVWFVLEPPGTRQWFPDPSRKSEVILKCRVKDASFLVSLVYNMFLITTCTVYAVKTRKIPENFNESKFIGFTMYTTCIIWLAFVPLFFGTGGNFEIQITTLCVSISLSAYVALFCLFSPKIYIILFHPDKNVRKLTMNSATYKRALTSSTVATASNHGKQDQPRLHDPPRSSQHKSLNSSYFSHNHQLSCLNSFELTFSSFCSLPLRTILLNFSFHLKKKRDVNDCRWRWWRGWRKIVSSWEPTSSSASSRSFVLLSYAFEPFLPFSLFLSVPIMLQTVLNRSAGLQSGFF